MNNPLLQGVLARTASAQGGTISSQSRDSGPVIGHSQEVQTSDAGEQSWRDTRVRTEQILNDVLINFGGTKTTSKPELKPSAGAKPVATKQVRQGVNSASKIAFVYGEAEESGYFSTEAPYRFGYRTGFPTHLLAALDELESEMGRKLLSVQWELAGEELIVFGEASEPAGEFLEKAMRKVQERTRQQINYPGGSVEAQSYSKVGKQLANYVQQQFNWRLGAGESIGYLESTPAIVAAAYRGMFAPAGSFAWQGKRLWIKGNNKDVAKFLGEAIPWMLEHGNS